MCVVLFSAEEEKEKGKGYNGDDVHVIPTTDVSWLMGED